MAQVSDGVRWIEVGQSRFETRVARPHGFGLADRIGGVAMKKVIGPADAQSLKEGRGEDDRPGELEEASHRKRYSVAPPEPSDKADPMAEANQAILSLPDGSRLAVISP